MIWMIGTKGILATALGQELFRRKIPFVATAKEQVDLRSKESLFAFARKRKWSHIINCAAYTAVDLAEEEREKAYALNVKGVENLIAVATTFSTRLVHISSDYVFDGKKEIPYKEEDECFPLSVYGETKREGEKRLEESQIDYTLLRISWLFGENENHFIAKILQKMKKNKELFVVNDQKGRMTFAKDAARVIVELLPYSGLYHFANAGIVSWYEIASFLFEEAKRGPMPLICEKIHPIVTKNYPTKAKRPSYSVLDTSKVEKLLKMTPRTWKEAVIEYLQRERT